MHVLREKKAAGGASDDGGAVAQCRRSVGHLSDTVASTVADLCEMAPPKPTNTVPSNFCADTSPAQTPSGDRRPKQLGRIIPSVSGFARSKPCFEWCWSAVSAVRLVCVHGAWVGVCRVRSHQCVGRGRVRLKGRGGWLVRGALECGGGVQAEGQGAWIEATD